MNEAILDNIREAAEKAAAAGVSRGISEWVATNGQAVIGWEVVVVAAGAVLGGVILAILRRTFGAKS